MNFKSHTPVMLDEIIASLNISSHGIYVDGTFGRGGYSQKILEMNPNVRLIGIDRDPSAHLTADDLKHRFQERFQFALGLFSDMDIHLKNFGYLNVDGIVLDLGVSSPQLDESERGFSFRLDGPLDMRMSQSGMSAETIVNTWSEQDLADIIYHYGDERLSRKVARAIVNARIHKKINTTFELANIVRSVVPRDRASDIDGATRTFQAIRIAVNQELDELETLLNKAPSLLKEGGRLSIVSFHSLEDRCVKRKFRQWCEPMNNLSRHLPNIKHIHDPIFRYIQRNGIIPGEDELNLNPRARSARLRTIEKIGG